MKATQNMLLQLQCLRLLCDPCSKPPRTTKPFFCSLACGHGINILTLRELHFKMKDVGQSGDATPRLFHPTGV